MCRRSSFELLINEQRVVWQPLTPGIAESRPHAEGDDCNFEVYGYSSTYGNCRPYICLILYLSAIYSRKRMIKCVLLYYNGTTERVTFEVKRTMGVGMRGVQLSCLVYPN